METIEKGKKVKKLNEKEIKLETPRNVLSFPP